MPRRVEGVLENPPIGRATDHDLTVAIHPEEMSTGAM